MTLATPASMVMDLAQRLRDLSRGAASLHIVETAGQWTHL